MEKDIFNQAENAFLKIGQPRELFINSNSDIPAQDSIEIPLVPSLEEKKEKINNIEDNKHPQSEHKIKIPFFYSSVERREVYPKIMNSLFNKLDVLFPLFKKQLEARGMQIDENEYKNLLKEELCGIEIDCICCKKLMHSMLKNEYLCILLYISIDMNKRTMYNEAKETKYVSHGSKKERNKVCIRTMEDYLDYISSLPNFIYLY